jgi:hypothetical protein
VYVISFFVRDVSSIDHRTPYGMTR